MFSERDHKGRILQNCLQLLPRLVLCGAERVGSGLRPGREGEVSALRGNQGAAWGLSKGQGELPGITGLKLTGVSKAHFSNHERCCPVPILLAELITAIDLLILVDTALHMSPKERRLPSFIPRQVISLKKL